MHSDWLKFVTWLPTTTNCSALFRSRVITRKFVLILDWLPAFEKFHFLKKWAILGLSSIIFSLFKQTIQILQQINVKKCSSSIRCHDSNSQPSDYESPPLTTRQGLPRYKQFFLFNLKSFWLLLGIELR